MCVCVGARARVCQSYDSLNLCYVIKKRIDRVNTFISMYELSRSGELVIYLLHSCKNFFVFLAIEAKSNRKQKKKKNNNNNNNILPRTLKVMVILQVQSSCKMRGKGRTSSLHEGISHAHIHLNQVRIDFLSSI